MAEAALSVNDELLIYHADYRPDLLEQYQDIYEGGDRFEKHKTKYLRARAFEQGPGPGAKAFRQQRLNSASYTNYSAQLIDWLVAATLQSQPQILAKGPPDKVTYYHSLNDNVDGTGKDLLSLCRSRLEQMMVHRRAYFCIDFPEASEEYPDLASQRKAGALDANICGLGAAEVEDWECDREGNLLWIRTHTTEPVRLKTWGPVAFERNTWSFITNEAIYEYEATRTIEDARKGIWQKDAVAKLKSETAHSLGALPIIACPLDSCFWVMQRLYPLAVSIFNREASLDFALDTSALALPILNSDQDVKSITANELAVLKLRVGESFRYEIPNAAHFQALTQNADDKRENLFGVVQAMALNSASMPSAGRQTALSKIYDQGLLATLLAVFASSVKNSVKQSVGLVQKVRGDDDVEITIQGLDKFDVQNIELLLKKTSDFVKLPISEVSADFALQKLELAMCQDADAPTKEKIRQAVRGQKPAVGESITPTPQPTAESNIGYDGN